MYLDKAPVVYAPNERGGLMLIHNGYPFIKERSCKRRISWHCRMKAALK